MRAALVAVVVVGACSSALHEPSPIAQYAPNRPDGRDADALVHAADAAWTHRAEPGQALAAQGLYLDAAVADARRADALVGAMKALCFRIEHESGAAKGPLAGEEVELGQWCQRRAPGDHECDYRLAIALGQQARERPSTGHDAMNRIVDLLRRAIAGSPRLDAAGPHRVLALVLLRAPAWPVGPGDPDAALGEARAAVALFPDSAENQLVLGEALAATDAPDDARTAYNRARALAETARAAGNPDASGWLADARAGLAHTAQ